MKNKFLIALLVAVVCVGSLIYVGVRSSAKAVVTVRELISAGSERQKIRLGARVAEGDIRVETEPQRVVKFAVKDIYQQDINQPNDVVSIVYQGIMPDTLRSGRDVIVEGDYRGGVFYATQLLTQCPSKYEPPKPK